MSTDDSSLAPSDWRLFLQRWLRHPRIVGAIAPSSSSLARAMLAAAAPLRGPVLELGAGTGVFTGALLAQGLLQRQLYVVERLPEFACALRRRFPGLQVLESDAAELSRDQLIEPVRTIVSGLPLRAMSEPQIERVLHAALRCAVPEACIVQFSYGLRCPVPRHMCERLGLRAKRVAWVGWNLPPASVWRLQQRADVTRGPDSA